MSDTSRESILHGEARWPENDRYSDEFVHVALAAGVEIDARDDEGFTALLIAAQYGREPILRALLAHGADPAAVVNGESALDIIQREREQKIAFYKSLPPEKRRDHLESRLRDWSESNKSCARPAP